MSSVVKTDGDVIRESNIPYEEGIVNRIKYSLKQIDSSENNLVHINAVANDIKGNLNIVNMGISHDKISTVLTLRASIGGNISIEKLLRKSRGLIRLFMKHCNRLQQVTVILCWILVVLPTNFFKWLYFTLIKRGI